MDRRLSVKAAIVAVGAAMLVSANAVQAQSLTLSNWVPPTHFIVKDILQPWMAEVSKVTQGRVSVNMLPKPVGSPPQHWELARKGVADITWGNFTYEPERTLWPCPAMTSSEDFAFMLERVAGSYIFIGNGDGDSPGACMVHNPAYDFNDDNIAVGTAFWVRLTERFLPVM